MVELDAAHPVEVNDDMAVVVNTHQDTFGPLELTSHDTDVAAFLVFEGCGVDVGEGVLVVVDHAHEPLHLTVGDDDGCTPQAIALIIMAVVHIAEVVGELPFELGELILVRAYDDEVEDGGHKFSAGSALLIVGDGPLHRHEVLDALTVEEVLHTEYFLGSGIEDAQGVPLQYKRSFGIGIGGSCRPGRGYRHSDCMYIIALHDSQNSRPFEG